MRTAIRRFRVPNLVTPAALVAASALSATALGAGADLEVTGISSATTYGEVNGQRSFAVGFETCNVGDTPIDWVFNTNRHPVLATQLYRLHDGRFEQLGLSLAFHEFFPLELNLCGDCTPSGDSGTLGVGCANVNSSGLGGSQNTLGPRTEINPATGVFQFPPSGFNQTGDAIFKRLRAPVADLTVPGARYFFETVSVAPDDAAAGNSGNNASHRETMFLGGSLNPQLVGKTAAGLPAIYAWQQADPSVHIAEAQTADGGRIFVASRAATDDDFGWRYDYAVYNLDSAINVVGFESPVPGLDDVITVLGETFRDVDYHSGDPVDGTDWEYNRLTFSARWDSQPAPALAALRNSIRWGTLYNFGYSSTSAPDETTVRVLLDDGTSLQIPAVAAAAARCGEGDFAEPYFVLDLADIQRYIQLFAAGSQQADIRPPFLVLDLADLQAFISGFVSGCP
jgi:hypothetical protein